jgi:capsular polysaccharide transport system permease protein
MFDLTGIGEVLTKVLAKRNPPDVTVGGSEIKSDSRPKVRVKRKINSNALSAVLLLTPILISGVYFFGIARSRYVVRSDFVIRKAEDSVASSAGGIAALLGGGNQSSLEDARFLDLYLESPQVLEDLMKTFDFSSAYATRGLDWFAGINRNATRERRVMFFKRQVVVQLQEVSGIITLRTIGLDPETAFLLNKFLLEKADEFVNRLNQDINRQQLEFAAGEVRKAEARVRKASDKLKAFQEQNEVLDPIGEASSSSAAIAALEQELGRLKVLEATKRRQFKDPNDPEVRLIADQVDELQTQIKSERLKLVSPSGRDLGRKTAEAERLKGEIAFATDLYKATLTASESTRVESLRKQKFMAVLSSPQKPEEPWNDWRYRGFFTVTVIILVSFALLKFILGMAESHRE